MAGVVNGPEGRLFPPSLDTLLAWCALFRHVGTLSNYLGYVKTGCLLVKADVAVCGLLLSNLDVCIKVNIKGVQSSCTTQGEEKC